MNPQTGTIPTGVPDRVGAGGITPSYIVPLQ
jgi:hypothetical protein